MATDGFWGALTGQTDPNRIARDMQYDLSSTALDRANGLDRTFINQGINHSARLNQRAGQYYGQAQQALDPNSQFNTSILSMLQNQNRRESADALAQQNMLSQRNLASQGMAGSGIGQANMRANNLNQSNQFANRNAVTRQNWLSGMTGRAIQLGGLGAQQAGLANQAYANATGMDMQQQQLGMQAQMGYDQGMNQQNANIAQAQTQSYITNRTNQGNMLNSLAGGLFGLAMGGG
jgi:hypothetical protein